MAPAPRNVLLITADQWRGDWLGAAGQSAVRTPHLDRLAAAGTLFRRHYTTASPCGPARASLHTGRYMFNHRSVRNGTPLDARFTNMALQARRAGLTPTLFGYTDSTADPRPLPPDDPLRRLYEGVLPGYSPALVLPEHAGPWLDWLAEQGRPDLATLDAAYPADSDGAAPYPAALSETAFLTGRAIAWLGRQRAPWFLHLSLLRPHPPWLAPREWLAIADPAAMPPAAGLAVDGPVHPLLAHLRGRIGRAGFLPGQGPAAGAGAAEVARARAVYAALIAEVDHHVGRLLATLEEKGEAGRTLVVFTSDHGEMLGDHRLFGKQGWFDPAFHVPMILRLPEARGGLAVDAFTESVDLMPTVLDWLGLDAPPECDGSSLLPFARGATPGGWRQEAVFEFDFRDVRTLAAEQALGLAPDQCCLAVLRGRRFKYVHFPALPPLLYDLEADPQETRDLSADPACAGVMLECARRLLSHRMLHADRTMTNMLAHETGFTDWRGPRTGPLDPATA